MSKEKKKNKSKRKKSDESILKIRIHSSDSESNEQEREEGNVEEHEDSRISASLSLSNSKGGDRTIFHIKAGTADWTPNRDDIVELAKMFEKAYKESNTSVFVTRDGVEITQIFSG